MQRKSKKSAPFARIVFFIPAVAIAAVVLIAFLTGAVGGSPTLVVRAQSSAANPTQLNVSATVGSVTQTTPFNLSLSEGTYTVIFGTLPWYSTPAPHTVYLTNGPPQYALGVYRPIGKVIVITPGGLNRTQTTALHGVTPVTWVNKQTSSIVLDVSAVGRFTIPSAGNYTYVFQESGSFTFSVLPNGFVGNVQVV